MPNINGATSSDKNKFSQIIDVVPEMDQSLHSKQAAATVSNENRQAYEYSNNWLESGLPAVVSS